MEGRGDPKEEQMAQWIDACATDAIENEDLIRFDHAGKQFMIYRSPDDAYFCTDGICTHEHVSLADGLVVEYEIECPKHGAAFDYRTGEALRSPACIDLRTYRTKVEGDRVFVEV